MISLNDYLYNGDTVLKIIQRYSNDLKENSIKTGNKVDMIHSNYLLRIEGLLVHNDFLTSQSQRIHEFYMYMADKYPFLAFTFKGRIKSLVRAEEKFNGYIVETIYNQYKKDGTLPGISEIQDRIEHVRDLIAYRIVISLPKCHVKKGMDRREEELKYLYEIANVLPDFLELRGFSPEISAGKDDSFSEKLREDVRPYFRDYVANPRFNGYESLHITLYDNESRSYVEVQVRTKDMDDTAKIGGANHLSYEKRQFEERTDEERVPQGFSNYYDEAIERGKLLEHLDLAKLDVNMFAAMDNTLVNDSCGLLRGRLILPYEHLSSFQTDGTD